MKHKYFKILTLALFVAGFSLESRAQTYVTVWSDDFETYRNDISLTTVGYEVWEGTGKSIMRAGEGHDGSNAYAQSDNSKTGFTLLRSIFPLTVGNVYRVSVATTYTDGVNHNPLNIRKINASGVDQGSSYFNNGVAAGTGDWQEWSQEFTVEAGSEGVRIQQYRFGKVHTLLVDDIKLETTAGIEWNGSSSTDWNTAANWNGGVVPTTTDHVLISDVATQPVITTDVEITSLEVADGASIGVSGASTLTVSGQLTGTGTGYAEIMSGASLIADRIIGSNHIVHRQTRFSNGQYSIVGSPVQIGRVSDLGSLVYGYDETVGYNSTVDNVGSGDDGVARFVEMPTTTDTLKVGKGYFSAFTDMMTFTGYPNNGDVSSLLTLTDHDATNVLDENNYEGYNLVSNPYTSSIDYDELVAVNGATAGSGIIEESIWIWDDNGSNSSRGSNSDYVTINAMGAVGTASTANSGLWDGFIRSGQGFFVKALSAGNLEFNSGMQVAGNNDDGGFYRQSAKETYQTLRLKVNGANGLSNETLIGFSDNSKLKIDYLDAKKLAPNGALKLYTLVGNTPLAIQALPSELEVVEVQVGFSAAEPGDFSISLGELTNWDSGYKTVLFDDLLGISKVLSSGHDIYQFSAESGQSNRFRLSISKGVLGVELAKSIEIKSTLDGLQINSINQINGSVNVLISDISGRGVFSQRIDTAIEGVNVPYSFLRNKVYIISIVATGDTYKQKILFK